MLFNGVLVVFIIHSVIIDVVNCELLQDSLIAVFWWSLSTKYSYFDENNIFLFLLDIFLLASYEGPGYYLIFKIIAELLS